MARKSADFVCVHGNQKFANYFKVKAVPAVVFTDADGDEIHRATFLDESGIEAAMKAALEKFQNRPVPWESRVGPPVPKKLLVVGFDDETGEALKVLEDRTIVKYHERCEFARLPSQREADDVRKWNVGVFPSIILCDASQENPEKSPIDRLTGRKSPAAVKLAIQKALARLESKK